MSDAQDERDDREERRVDGTNGPDGEAEQPNSAGDDASVHNVPAHGGGSEGMKTPAELDKPMTSVEKLEAEVHALDGARLDEQREIVAAAIGMGFTPVEIMVILRALVKVTGQPVGRVAIAARCTKTHRQNLAQ